MIKDLKQNLRIKTIPLNWVIQIKKGKRWLDYGYLDHLDQVRRIIKNEFIKPEKEDDILNKLDEIKNDLGLKTYDELSAWYLTKKVKHPEFKRKVSRRSLQNLK